jgi:RNA polymerase sigma-70 factor (ECF subfamily)
LDLHRGASVARTADRDLDGLYREHRAWLCAYVRRAFGSGPPEPEDIAQEAFARFAALADSAEVPNPKAFLALTARNLAIDAYRKAKRGSAAVLNLHVLSERTHDCDPSDVLSSREELQRLAGIIDLLPPKQRVAFLMHRLDGLSFAEIGRRLRISQSGARFLVNSALAACVAGMRK